MDFKGELIKEGSGDAGSIRLLKIQLNERIGANLDVNNPNFGPLTKEWVQAFQRKNNLIPDGVVGELTWERLFKQSVPHPIMSANIAIRAEEIAFTQLHVRELTGRNDGPEVEKYLKSVGLGKGYAWCMAFSISTRVRRIC